MKIDDGDARSRFTIERRNARLGSITTAPYFFVLGSSAGFTNLRSVGPTPCTCTTVS